MNRLIQAFWSFLKSILAALLALVALGPGALPWIVAIPAAPVASLLGWNNVAQWPLKTIVWFYKLAWVAVKDLLHIIEIVDGERQSEAFSMLEAAADYIDPIMTLIGDWLDRTFFGAPAISRS